MPALAAAGRSPLDRLVTHRFDLADAAAAIDTVADHGRTDRLKVVLAAFRDARRAEPRSLPA